MGRRDTAPARGGWPPATSLEVTADRFTAPRAVRSLRRRAVRTARVAGTAQALRIARAVRPVDARVRAPLSALSFWLAIVLPAGYLSLLAAGIDDPRGLFLFLGLLGLHVLALVGGRGHATAGHR